MPIVNAYDLGSLKQDARDDAKTTALRFGCFDLFHEGHMAGLEIAKSMADILVVGVLSDGIVSLRKGVERPVRRQEQRVSDVDQYEYADYTFLVDGGVFGLARAVVSLNPNVLVDNAESNIRNRIVAVGAKILSIDYAIDSSPKVQSPTGLIKVHEAQT